MTMNIAISHLHGTLRTGLAALAALLITAGCGGGGGDVPATTTQGRAVTQGTITGFGSIIVNGIRFDESAAQVIDDDGQAHDRNELKLGMNVEVESSRIDRRSMSAKASRVRFGAAIVGPVSAISAGTTPKTLTLLPVRRDQCHHRVRQQPGQWPGFDQGRRRARGSRSVRYRDRPLPRQAHRA